MKTLVTICAIAPFLLGTLNLNRPSADGMQLASAEAKDKEAVLRAGLNYVEGLYQAKPELIEQSVHTNLSKLGFYRSNADEAYQTSPMTYEALVKLSGSWNKSGKLANEDSLKKVELLDLMDTIAVLKVSAVWGVDYMQLGKFDGQWKILHILWQSHPEE